MQVFNRTHDRAKERALREEKRKKDLQLKIRRQLYANASSNKRLEKETQMKQVFKRRARRNPKYQGISQINYDLFM